MPSISLSKLPWIMSTLIHLMPLLGRSIDPCSRLYLRSWDRPWRSSSGSGSADKWDRTDSDSVIHLPVTASGIILVLCFLIFFLKEIANLFDPGLVDSYLAFYPPLLASRPWTLITYMFDHGNLDHLLFNMLFLFFFGMELERRIGEGRFVAVYILSGVVAALGNMLVSPVPVIGASGALYGIMGCLAILAPEIRVLLFFVLPLRIGHAIILFALMDFLMMGSMDNIAHMAHIIGLGVGLVFGILLKRRVSKVHYYQ